MTEQRAITTRTARIWLDDGIVHCESLPQVENAKEDAVENFSVMWEVTGHQRRPCLVDMRRLWGIDHGARAHYAGPESMRRHLAVAIVVASPLSLLLGNFFMGLNKPPIPSRLFTSEPEALAWLQRFIVDDVASAGRRPELQPDSRA